MEHSRSLVEASAESLRELPAELILELRRLLQLRHRETLVYLTIVKAGKNGTRAKRIQKETNIAANSDMYTILHNLRTRGLITLLPGYPAVYKSIPIAWEEIKSKQSQLFEDTMAAFEKWQKDTVQ